MPIKVYEDILWQNKNQLTLRADTYWRAFLVSGIGGPGPAQYGLARTAVDSVTGFAVPQIYSQHPDVANAWADDVQTSGLGGGVFRVLVRYTKGLQLPTPGGFLESCDVAFRQFESYVDVNNDPISISFKAADGSTQTQPGKVLRDEMIITQRFELVETNSPRLFNLSWGGCINSQPWIGTAARTWRFLGVVGSTSDQKNFKNRYTFEYKASTWDEVAWYQNARGELPAQVTAVDLSAGSGQGWTVVKCFNAVDFNVVFPAIS